MTMNFTPVEWIALILMVIVAIKLIVILVSPKAWFNSVAKPLWKNAGLMTLVSLVLAAVVLYYLLVELTIVQILAVMAFLALLAAVGVGTYKKEVLALADKLLKDKTIIRKSWLYILIWAVLILWGAGVLFGIV